MKFQKFLKVSCFLAVLSLVLSFANVSYAHNDNDRNYKNWWRFPRISRNTNKPPLVYLFATKYAIKNGKSTTMYWDAKRADSCSVSGSGWSGARPVKAEEVVSPTVTTEYTITCINAFGSYTDSATITVKGSTTTPPVIPLPTLSFSASSTLITQGSTTMLGWTSTNSNACNATLGWTGSKSLAGNQSVTPAATTTYTLACGNGNSTTTESVTVNVIVPVVPPVNLDHLIISEVYYDVGTGKGEEPDNEWIELYNGTGSTVDLSHWFIVDTFGEFDKIPSGTTIANGAFLIITASSTTPPFWSNTPMLSLENRLGNALGNSDESIYLKNTASTTVDAMGYGTDVGAFSPAAVDVVAGHSLRRTSLTADTNTAADWEDLTVPTPGSF